MKIFRENIAIADNYTTKEGEEKTKWHTVGSITTFVKVEDGVEKTSKILELPLLSVKASVFPWKPKVENVEGSSPIATPQPMNADGSINLEPQVQVAPDSLDAIDFEG